MPVVDADEHQLARRHAHQRVFAKARLSTPMAALQPNHPASQQGSKEPGRNLDVSTVHQRAPATLNTVGLPWSAALLAQMPNGAKRRARCLAECFAVTQAWRERW